MYVRKEAVLSTQIEGTTVTLFDLVQGQAKRSRPKMRNDVREVQNYINALNYGLEQLDTLPVSNRLIRTIHKKLMMGVRGRNRDPGNFRRVQNQIGGTSAADAQYLPPPPNLVIGAMSDLEKFIHDSNPMPPLIKAALVHSQFETIHPFLDGNGRMGRLLITLLLCSWGTLERPLLYLSHHFKRYRMEYNDRLQLVRDEGDWEGWLEFFLEAVRSVSEAAAEKTRKIQQMREDHLRVITKHIGPAANILEHLLNSLVVSITSVSHATERSYASARTYVAKLVDIGLLKEITIGIRNRLFLYEPYLNLLEE